MAQGTFKTLTEKHLQSRGSSGDEFPTCMICTEAVSGCGCRIHLAVETLASPTSSIAMSLQTESFYKHQTNSLLDQSRIHLRLSGQGYTQDLQDAS